MRQVPKTGPASPPRVPRARGPRACLAAPAPLRRFSRALAALCYPAALHPPLQVFVPKESLSLDVIKQYNVV